MKEKKRQVSMRLAESTLKEMAEIAKRQGVGQTDVIAILVHLYATGADFENIDEWFDIARMS